MNKTPEDWKDPDWNIGDGKHIHEWKAYANADVQKLWQHMSDDLKKSLAKNYQDIADDVNYE